ncbi:Ig-like domain-containing protein [Cellulomonas sp. ICMP 17802]|uniref:Ig-like domain-containing protein n=1 Tax=Cellulomonas sp. ICMP 17802 TaxID=3239199 RepID=UPI00351B1522
MGVRAALATALLAVLGLVLAPAPAALADFASQCAAPDRTVAAGDPSISVAAGETVLVASSYTGGIDALPAGSTLCVGPAGALTASYMNNAAGAVVVAASGTLTMPSVAVAAGFSLELEGTATFAGLNVNGAADLHVAAGGQLTITGSFSPAAGTFVNEGTFRVEGSMNLNTAVTLENSGTVAVQGSTTVNGPLVNSGLADLGGGLTINGSGSLQNSCAVNSLGPLINNGAGSGNQGLVLVSGGFTNNGGWQQGPDGVTSAVAFTDDGSVTGFGGYRFSGPSSVQGSFVGDSAADPVRVQSVAPPGQVFDTETGVIANVVRAPVDLLAALPACVGPPGQASADVEVVKSAPATVLTGDVLTYSVVVRNNGTSDAADVVVSDALPAGFVLDPGSTTGTLAGGVLTWQVGALAVGQAVALPFSGTVTAPAGSTLLNAASSTSSTPDPTPSNNDGSAETSRTSTQVLAVPPPPNLPPVADDAVRDTTTGALVVGAVTATDPDAGQELAFSVATPPAHGRLVLTTGGAFVYLSARDFAGVDTFEFTVCDNASPTPACDTGTVTVNVLPRAVDDVAQTFAGTPVAVQVLSNDTAGAPLDAVAVTPPANGSVTLDPATGRATYTPGTGFTGSDSFEYRICSPTEPGFCDTAQVLVTVVSLNLPPTVAPLLLTTTTGSPVTGPAALADPNPGDTLTATSGFPPRSGTASVAPTGTVTYTPRPGFAGRDLFGDIVCDDGTPQLCATGTVTVEVFPVATPDAGTTAAATPVDVALVANDLGAVGAATVTGAPAHGTVTVSGGTARYVPAAGFAGTDTFEYTICAATAPDLCATTTVTITVTAAPVPPAPDPPAPDTGGALAVTGAEVLPVLLLGLVLLAAGVALVVVIRRRR